MNRAELYSQILDIKSDLIAFDSSLDEFLSIMKETILINNDIICREEMNLLKQINNNLIHEITEDIIPTLSDNA